MERRVRVVLDAASMRPRHKAAENRLRAGRAVGVPALQ